MRLIDTHAHIQQHDPAELSGILDRAEEARLGAVIAAGVTVDDSQRCIELAKDHELIFAGVGVHPTDLTGPLTNQDLSSLDEMAANKHVIVMSEIGIDHQAHVLARESDSNRPRAEIQEEAFRQQIDIARQHSLPLVFHVREPGDDPEANSAWPVAFASLEQTSGGDLGGTAHYFQGNADTARAVLDAGFMISFARPLLRLKRLQEIAKWLPADRMVLESDSYPQPFKKNRDNWTEPRHVLEVAECLAELRGVKLDKIAEVTSENALRMLGSHANTVEKRLGH